MMLTLVPTYQPLYLDDDDRQLHKAIEEGRCNACGTEAAFKSSEAKREYTFSGLCQACQTKQFGRN
jgi:hypothetical protein